MKLVERLSLREEILATLAHHEDLKDMTTEDRKILWDMLDEQLSVKGLNKFIVPVLFSVVAKFPTEWKALCSDDNINRFFYNTNVLALINKLDNFKVPYLDMEAELLVLLTTGFLKAAHEHS